MKKIHPRPVSAFSLVEMLVVIAVIGILTALAVPAFRGLVGTSGVRGGADTILSAFDLARNAAVESGANAYLVFPNNTYSRFTVVSMNATGGTNLATPRWFRLPNGIQIDFTETNSLFSTDLANYNPTNLPRLDGSNAVPPLRAIRFNRFGSLPSGLAANLQLHVGEGFSDATNPVPTFTAPTSVFIPQPLLGKWIPATNN
jgi:prepilin-type N-terminal cleavage/methylation domain-containing protein